MYLQVFVFVYVFTLSLEFEEYHDPEFVFPGESNHKEVIRTSVRSKSIENDMQVSNVYEL